MHSIFIEIGNYYYAIYVHFNSDKWLKEGVALAHLTVYNFRIKKGILKS